MRHRILDLVEGSLVPVVGNYYRNVSEKALYNSLTTKSNVRIRLIFDVNNRYDANAIKVVAFKDGKTFHLGFVDRMNAANICKYVLSSINEVYYVDKIESTFNRTDIEFGAKLKKPASNATQMILEINDVTITKDKGE